MTGSTDSIGDDTSRLFEVRLGPHPSAGEWVLRVHQLDPWTEHQREGWMDLIQQSFTSLASAGGLCGQQGHPLAPALVGHVEWREVDDWMEWRFGVLAIDPRSASLLLNLCEWGTFNIAPISEVELLIGGLSLAQEPPDRPLPQRAARLSFALQENVRDGQYSSIEVEFARRLTEPDIQQISHDLRPWHHALFRWGFALSNLAPGASEVRLDQPPVVIVDDLWCWNFEMFVARDEAIDVLLNCLERIHHTICPVKTVAVE